MWDHYFCPYVFVCVCDANMRKCHMEWLNCCIRFACILAPPKKRNKKFPPFSPPKNATFSYTQTIHFYTQIRGHQAHRRQPPFHWRMMRAPKVNSIFSFVLLFFFLQIFNLAFVAWNCDALIYTIERARRTADKWLCVCARFSPLVFFFFLSSFGRCFGFGFFLFVLFSFHFINSFSRLSYFHAE